MKFRWTLFAITVALFGISGIFKHGQKSVPTVSGQSSRSSSVRRKIPDFWSSARIGNSRADFTPDLITPESLGIDLAKPIDHAALLSRAIAADDARAIQVAAYAWFVADPEAVRDWLNTQTTLEDLQPALSFIAEEISQRGDFENALRWSELLEPGSLHDETVFALYVDALRCGKISAAEIPADILPPEMMANLTSGAAGD